MSTAPEPTSFWKTLIQPGSDALREHWKPILLIQILAILIAVMYYRSAELRAFAAHLAAIKHAGGLWFSFLFGGAFCATMIEIAKFLTGSVKHFGREEFGDAAYTAFAYGLILVVVDVMQQGFAVLFGAGIDADTLLRKTLVDQFIMTPFFFMPFGLILFRWRAERFKLRALLALGQRNFWTNDVATTLLPAWAFWFPTLLAVYSMPTNLQFVFVICCDAAWAMIFVFMAKSHAEPIVAVP